MKNEHLAELISDVSDARVSLVSCVTDEQRTEWLKLSAKVNALALALVSIKVSKRKSSLIEKADRVLGVASEMVNQYRAAFREADAQYSQMAFAGEWR